MILRISTVSLPELQKKKGADVDFQAVLAHVSDEEHQVSPRGASDWWRASFRKSVSVYQDKFRRSEIQFDKDQSEIGDSAPPTSDDRRCQARRLSAKRRQLPNGQQIASALGRAGPPAGPGVCQTQHRALPTCRLASECASSSGRAALPLHPDGLGECIVLRSRTQESTSRPARPEQNDPVTSEGFKPGHVRLEHG